MKLGQRGAAAEKRRSTGFDIDQLLHMPEDEKIEMCLDLLDEFGAQNVSVIGDEIQHSCCLPFGLHANGDRNPSAHLNWRKLTYHCYGCGSGGGLLWFVSTCKGDDTGGVVSWVTKRIGEESESKGLENFLQYIDRVYSPEVNRTAQPVPKFNRHVLDGWRFVHPYLTEVRHVPQSNIVAHDVGYDPKSDRIVLPHFWKGDLVGWQTRSLKEWQELLGEPQDTGPKYKNTPDFPKDTTLYNKPADLREPLLVVESVMSVVSKSHLWPTMCATFGASVTERQKLLLSDHSRIILWFDNDQAGWTATEEVGETLSNYCDVTVVESDLDADAADVSSALFTEMVSKCTIAYGLWQPPMGELKKVNNDTP